MKTLLIAGRFTTEQYYAALQSICDACERVGIEATREHLRIDLADLRALGRDRQVWVPAETHDA
jgi:hypothetical protein